MKFKIAFLVSIVFFITGCANLSLNDVYRQPTFSYQSTGIEKVNFDALFGSSKIQIKNTNPYQLPISQLSSELWLEGKPWLTLSNPAIDGLPANAATSVELQWQLIFDELLSRAASVYQAGEAEFTLRMQPTLQVPVLGAQTLDWTSSFTIPVPKLPTVRLQDWSVAKVNFTSVTLALAVAVDNPNVFAINTRGWKLDVADASRSLAKLNLKDGALKAKGQSIQEVELTLSIADAGLAIFNVIKAGQWPENLALNWQGDWSSPDLDFSLPSLAGKL